MGEMKNYNIVFLELCNVVYFSIPFALAYFDKNWNWLWFLLVSFACMNYYNKPSKRNESDKNI